MSNVENTAVLYGVSQKELAEILGVSLQSIKKLNVAKNLPLNKNLSERILRLQEIMYLAHCYFGQDETAMRWFQDVNKGLDYKKPFTVCDTFYGMERVENSLIKLVHGMTA